MTLATLSDNYALRIAVQSFNQTQSDYLVRLLDYSVYNTTDDNTSGLTRLHTEILAGQVPDIIDLTGLPVERYVANGLLGYVSLSG